MTGSHDDDPDGRRGQDPGHDTPYWPFAEQQAAGEDDPTLTHPAPEQPPQGYPPPTYGPPGYGPGSYPPPEHGATGYPPPDYGTPHGGPYGDAAGGVGQGPPPPPGPHRSPSVLVTVVVVLAVLAALVVVFALGSRDDADSSATPAPTVGGGVTVLPPLPTTSRRSTPSSSQPSRTVPSTSAPSPTLPSTTAAAAATRPPNPSQSAQITALGSALVTAISTADRAALAQLTCGPLAEEVKAEPAEGDPTVFDRVDNILVSEDGTSGTMDVWAYTVENGPPANQVTFQVQLVGGSWRACDYES